ncbi:Uncharacterized protein FWK35_00005571, partial [Aphis craccivora]
FNTDSVGDKSIQIDDFHKEITISKTDDQLMLNDQQDSVNFNTDSVGDKSINIDDFCEEITISKAEDRLMFDDQQDSVNFNTDSVGDKSSYELKNSSNEIGNTNLILKDVPQNGTNLDVTENNALFTETNYFEEAATSNYNEQLRFDDQPNSNHTDCNDPSGNDQPEEVTTGKFKQHIRMDFQSFINSIDFPSLKLFGLGKVSSPVKKAVTKSIGELKRSRNTWYNDGFRIAVD